jgi:uncharacterized membrane protein
MGKIIERLIWSLYDIGLVVLYVLLMVFDPTVGRWEAFAYGALSLLFAVAAGFFIVSLIDAVKDYIVLRRLKKFSYILEHPHPSETAMDTIRRAQAALHPESKKGGKK